MGEAKRRRLTAERAARVCKAGCGTELTPEFDSEAHIIPNALGGRLKPKGIICKACNTKLGDVADNALVSAFGAWPTLLDLPRDRGNNPPRIVRSTSGRKVRATVDGDLTAMDVEYKVTPTVEGELVEISAGDWKTIRQLLKRAAKEFPQLDPVEAEAQARVVRLDEHEKLHLQFDFSPQATFGGVVTAVWLFVLHRLGHALMPFDELLKFIVQTQKTGGPLRHLVDGLPGLSGPDIPLSHKIVVRTVPERGEMIAYVEVLGVLRIGGVFAKASGPTKLYEEIYVYDLVAKQDRSAEFSIDPSTFDAQNWATVGVDPKDDPTELKARIVAAFEEILVTRYQGRFVDEPD